MRFNKQQLVDIKTLTKIEGEEFRDFLQKERERHIETAIRCSVRSELWLSELKRQNEEVEHIDGGIEEVNKKFGWGDK